MFHKQLSTLLFISLKIIPHFFLSHCFICIWKFSMIMIYCIIIQLTGFFSIVMQITRLTIMKLFSNNTKILFKFIISESQTPFNLRNNNNNKRFLFVCCVDNFSFQWGELAGVKQTGFNPFYTWYDYIYIYIGASWETGIGRFLGRVGKKVGRLGVGQSANGASEFSLSLSSCALLFLRIINEILKFDDQPWLSMKTFQRGAIL